MKKDTENNTKSSNAKNTFDIDNCPKMIPSEKRNEQNDIKNGDSSGKK